MIVSIAEDRFNLDQNRRVWIALLGVESNYDQSAVSEDGAVGMGQLLPRFRNDFGKSCGITDVAKADLRDAYTNAYLSACFFKNLLSRTGGSIPLALISYNAGANSKSLEKALAGLAPGREPADYTTKVMIQKDRAEQ